MRTELALLPFALVVVAVPIQGPSQGPASVRQADTVDLRWKWETGTGRIYEWKSETTARGSDQRGDEHRAVRTEEVQWHLLGIRMPGNGELQVLAIPTWIRIVDDRGEGSRASEFDSQLLSPLPSDSRSRALARLVRAPFVLRIAEDGRIVACERSTPISSTTTVDGVLQEPEPPPADPKQREIEALAAAGVEGAMRSRLETILRFPIHDGPVARGDAWEADWHGGSLSTLDPAMNARVRLSLRSLGVVQAMPEAWIVFDAAKVPVASEVSSDVVSRSLEARGSTTPGGLFGPEFWGAIAGFGKAMRSIRAEVRGELYFDHVGGQLESLSARHVLEMAFDGAQLSGPLAGRGLLDLTWDTRTTIRRLKS